MADDYRQKLDHTSHERIRGWKFILQVDQEASVETDIFKTEQILSNLIEPKVLLSA